MDECLQKRAVLDLRVEDAVELRDDAVALVEHLSDLAPDVLQGFVVHLVGLSELGDHGVLVAFQHQLDVLSHYLCDFVVVVLDARLAVPDVVLYMVHMSDNRVLHEFEFLAHLPQIHILEVFN